MPYNSQGQYGTGGDFIYGSSPLYPGVTSTTQNPVNPNAGPLSSAYALANAAVKTDATNQGAIQSGYQNLVPPAPRPFQPTPYQYQPTSDYTGAVSNLRDLSQSGGYSPSDIADLRARGISPIRSVYSSAQSNIDRAKSLAGGYSPGYTAATAKLTRGLSDAVSSGTQNVNADIASRVAGNKLQVAPELASTAFNNQQAQNQTGMENTQAANTAGYAATQLPFQTYDEAVKALQGQTSLYGTTPALSSLFGSQALSAAQLQELIRSQNMSQSNNGLNTIAQAVGRA